MLYGIPSPAQAAYGTIPGRYLFLPIAMLGIGFFAYLIVVRLVPLSRAQSDPRHGEVGARLSAVVKYWLAQWKQPRYPLAGILHILIFFGFLALAIRSTSLVIMGILADVHLLAWMKQVAQAYTIVTCYAATLVFVATAVAAVRRLFFHPARYTVPERYGKGHGGEALIVLGLIATLMVSEGLFEASGTVTGAMVHAPTESLPTLTLAWMFQRMLQGAAMEDLRTINLVAYFVHDVTFFAFLCFLPMGKHFHVVTSLFNVYFAKLNRGTIKPVNWGLAADQLDQVKSVGVKKFEDFTWKHMLDFYSCADCGRCSDNCPANAVGRPLSPRFITIKARDYSFRSHPIFGAASNGQALMGNVFEDDELWSCTTCGACEEECPLLIEYIDKIVDLRRGMVDDGNVPKSLQKPLKALESRGNPYGKMEKKRADWANEKEFQSAYDVRELDPVGDAKALFFVDSITSYDDRMQSIGRATARVLTDAGEKFGILGAEERDSGHEARRFGEETLFQILREHNTEAIRESGATRIVTADPHAYNSLKHDYTDVPPVEHISELVAREVKAGKIKFKPVGNPNDVYAYHDPCYLGRHNQVYDEPRAVLDAIPGLKRVEMGRSRDRSFCCGGGGLMLFYEPKEDQRMGVLRVKMAAEAGANVIVTACPFCMVNIEDAIKVAGREGEMAAIDLVELVDQQMVRDSAATAKV